MLDRVVNVVRRHLDRQPDAVLGQLLDFGLHPAIQAEPLERGSRPTGDPRSGVGSQATPRRLAPGGAAVRPHPARPLDPQRRGPVNGDPSVPVPLTAQGREEAARLGHQLARAPDRPLRPHALRPDARNRSVHPRRPRRPPARGTAPRRHRRRRSRGLHARGLSRVEGRTRALGRVPGRREPRRRRPPVRPRLPGAPRPRRAGGARRLPRDPDPLRAQRRRGVERPRRAGARDPERDPVPVRRALPRTSGRRDRTSDSLKEGARNRRRMRPSNRWTCGSGCSSAP